MDASVYYPSSRGGWLQALHAAGVAKVQLLAHSMGAMVLLHHTLTLTLTPTLTPTPTPTLTLALAPSLTSALTPVLTPTPTPTPNPTPKPKVLLHALPTLCASPLLRDGHLQLLSVTLLSPDLPTPDPLFRSCR